MSLTAEKANQIVALVRGGISLETAADITDTPLRTLQGWVARGSGRSRQPSTPKLRAFTRALTRAKAEATASAEVWLHEHQAAAWLRNAAAKSTEPPEESGDGAPSEERILDLARRLRDVLLYTQGSEVVPPCLSPRCRCVFHRERTPEELAATRAMASKGARS